MMKLKSRGCNVYLIEVDDRRFLIDTGTDGKLVSGQLRELDGVLITHAHFDHVAGAFEVEKTFGCPIFAHPEDIPYILCEKRFEYRGLLGFFAKLFEKLYRIKPPEDLRSIFELKDVNFIHLPGHTPGSVCFFFGENSYCGDLLRGKGKLSHRNFCHDYATYLNSVRKFLSLEWKKAFPGHGGEIVKDKIKKII